LQRQQLDRAQGCQHSPSRLLTQTSSEKYGWMNRICSIASGSLGVNAGTLDVFQVL
jgi:hypothetical protein